MIAVAAQNYGKRLCIFLKVVCQLLLCSLMLRHPIHSKLEHHQDLISDYFKTYFLMCKCILNVSTYTVINCSYHIWFLMIILHTLSQTVTCKSPLTWSSYWTPPAVWVQRTLMKWQNLPLTWYLCSKWGPLKYRLQQLLLVIPFRGVFCFISLYHFPMESVNRIMNYLIDRSSTN